MMIAYRSIAARAVKSIKIAKYDITAQNAFVRGLLFIARFSPFESSLGLFQFRQFRKG